jgi:outer membrane biosynthesis protein TonB
MTHPHTRRIKITIIAASLLIHGGVAFFLLIPELNHAPSRPMTLFTNDIHTQSQIPETTQEIKQSPASQATPQQPSQQQESPEESFEWAEMKMGAGNFGAPVEFVDYADVPEYGHPDGDEIGTETQQEEQEELVAPPQELSKDPSIRTSTSLSTTQDVYPSYATQGSTFLAGDHTQSDIEQPKPERKKTRKKKGATKGVTLAHLAQGYLDSLDQGGSYTIGMAGNPNKLPTNEQLQLENFSGKLIWHVQNIHHINFERFNLPAMQSSIHIYFMLDRKGHMSNLKILQSSGNAKVDDYILYLFKEASSSFPPLPQFIKQDPAPLNYTLQIYFAPESPIRVHRSFS